MITPRSMLEAILDRELDARRDPRRRLPRVRRCLRARTGSRVDPLAMGSCTFGPVDLSSERTTRIERAVVDADVPADTRSSRACVATILASIVYPFVKRASAMTRRAAVDDARGVGVRRSADVT